MNRSFDFTRILLLAITLPTFAMGLTIRDDVADQDYIDASADVKFESAGYMGVVGESVPRCSATLIHPEWVLTAGHCSQSSPPRSFFLGPDSNLMPAGVLSDSIIRHPSFNNNLALGNDMGVYHLTTPVLDVTPAQVYRGGVENGKATTVIGYGRTGTGLTGENTSLPYGLRRAGQNWIDFLGNQVGGLNSLTMLSDFDDPNNATDNSSGAWNPQPLESAVANRDSGAGWFQEIAGIHYLTGVTSFRSENDGAANSDYGDFNVAGRVSRQITWLNNATDWTAFASGPDWHGSSSWNTGSIPDATEAAVINRVSVIASSATAIAEYAIVEFDGNLNLSVDIDTKNLIVRRGGVLELGPLSAGFAANVTGDFQQDATGELKIGIFGTSSDLLDIAGEASLAGKLEIETSGYAAPTVRGDHFDTVVVQSSDLSGEFTEVVIDGETLGAGPTYVGMNANGDDGLFRDMEYNSATNEVIFADYLALRGDANGDRVVDISDLNIWSSNKFTTGTWADGDFDGDGFVDISDLNIWSGNKFAIAPGTVSTAVFSAVPEPTSAVMLMLFPVIYCLTIRRRR